MPKLDQNQTFDRQRLGVRNCIVTFEHVSFAFFWRLIQKFGFIDTKMKQALTLLAIIAAASSLHAQSPVLNITQGGSTSCAGTLYDSGGASGDYGPNENHTFVICPDVQSECISFSLEFYNLEPTLNPLGSGSGDQLSFYDGNSTSAPLLASLDGAGLSQQNIAGGGGVCFKVQAKSGCLTISFQSDISLQQEGWKGSWQCSGDPCEPVNVLVVDTTDITGSAIVNALSASGATVTVTDIRCDSIQYGTFNYASVTNDLNMGKGLLLTTGRATNAQGPNNLESLGTLVTPFNDAGDADLNYLSTFYGSASESHDACIVEMDVLAETDEVVFEYVFGSEEYPEFLFSNGGFNDIFAFLVSGPGIAGDPGLTNSALNIAVLPNSATPVQIDSVNNQINWQYYRNNELGQSIQYDGLTSDYLGLKKSLTARVPVQPCKTYHLKLAIADRGDEKYDSGVFISEIKAGAPEAAIQFASGIDYFVENCSGNKDTLFIQLAKPPAVATTFDVSLGGTATEGTDYLLNILPSITFQAGQTSLAFPIIPLSDALPEGTETILIQISRNYGCNDVLLKTLQVEIRDGVNVSVSGGDTLKVCKGDFVQLQASGANTYSWQPASAVSNPNIANPVSSPTQSLWLKVKGNVGTCEGLDSIFLKVVGPTIAVSALTPAAICLGGSVDLQAIIDPINTPVIWTPPAGLNNPNDPNPTASPTVSVSYTASITAEGCTVEASVAVIVDTLDFPVLVADTIVCQNYPVQLANVLNSTTQFEWTPDIGLSNPNISGPIALPDQTTTYTLVATSPNNACTQTASVTITILEADLEIAGDSIRLLCLGESDTLTANANPAGSAITWTPATFLNTTTGPTVIASMPDESVTYVATYSVVSGNQTCVEHDSVRMKVDSLPYDLSVRKVLDKDVYCIGDTIRFLLNTIYDPGNFTGIQFFWPQHGTFLGLPGIAQYQASLVVLALDTFTYQRFTQIGGCVDTTEVHVDVFTPPTVTGVAVPPIICPGGTATITVEVDPENPDYEYEWDPMTAGTLTCPTCLITQAMPFQTTVYTLGIKDLPCPAGTSVAVFVEPFPILDLPQDPAICTSGPSSILNNSSQVDVTYDWTPGLFLNDSTIAGPVSTTLQDIIYHVVAQNNFGAHCTAEGDVTVKYYNASIEAGPDQVICEGGNAILTATPIGDPGTLNWSPGNETTPSITVSPDSLQNYLVNLLYGDGKCIALDSVKVDVILLPELNLNPNTSICLGASVALALLPNGPGAFQWTPTTGLNFSNISNPIATPTDTITYMVTATNQNCPAVTGSVTVYVADANVDVGQDKTICFGETLTLTAATTGSVDSIIWMPGHIIAPSINVTPVLTTTYTATIYYGTNCNDEDKVKITVIPPIALLDIVATPDPQDSLCEGIIATLRVEIIGGTDVNLVWTANGTTIPGATADSLVISPVDNVAYSVVATVATGCTAVVDPVVYHTKQCFEIPNAFTPNGDGSNDTFGAILLGGNAVVTKFLIFNRWGEKVFEAAQEKTAWDGRTDGKIAPSDVYVYYMVVRFANGDEREYHGDVTLLR